MRAYRQNPLQEILPQRKFLDFKYLDFGFICYLVL